MRIAVASALAGVAFVLATDSVVAQALTSGRFTVTPLVGTIRFDDASALANKKADADGEFTENVFTPTIGLSADYKVTRQVGLGFYFEAARPQTRGDYFPSLLLNFGPNAELRTISQRVTLMMYGLQGMATFGVGALQPYVAGGAGFVTINGDPQQNDRNESFTNTQFQFGGGIGYAVSGNTTLRLDVRDFVFTSWDRNELYPVNPDFQNTLFPSANGNPPADKSTVHNIRIGLGFSYVPRSVSPADEGNQE
jgi:opacity protein-like surface antigen